MQYKGLDTHIKHVLTEKAITPDTRLPVDHSNQYAIHADALGNSETYTNKSNAYHFLNFFCTKRNFFKAFFFMLQVLICGIDIFLFGFFHIVDCSQFHGLLPLAQSG